MLGTFLPYFEILIGYAENTPIILTAAVVSACIVRKPYRYVAAAAPFVFVLAVVIGLVVESHMLATESGADLSLPDQREALENYINTGTGDPNDIIESGKYPNIFGSWALKRLVCNLLPMAMFHNSQSDNEQDVPEAYNKGDDWFEATLGEPMVYTSAIYLGPNETMWDGQVNKLNYILDSTGIKQGDRVLDIGCGWGRLLQWYAKHGAQAYGITLSEDQAKYGRRLNAAHGDKVNILLDNFMTIDLPKKSFQVISAVEMAEHVGIRNYQSFLKRVHSLLADDGTFYIQVAGLRRGYGEYNPFEEHTWGLFMEQHVFPGADASCPMGWVVTHLERAGFEVQRAQNLGWHYSQTLYHWLQVWINQKQRIVGIYGERSWRRWQVFLAWSVRIARRGGSSVFMLVATKAGQEQARMNVQDRLAKQLGFTQMAQRLGMLQSPSTERKTA